MSNSKTEQKIIEKLKTVFDPEIPVNIYDLGLIYEINLREEGFVHILMTLTSPNCPVAESLPLEVKHKAEEIEEITYADIDLTFEPPWTDDMLTDEAKLELGLL